MNFREAFEQRKLDLHNKVKQEIQDELNTLSGKNTRQGWSYEDGYFYCQVKDKDILVLLKSDFEPYLFNAVAVLPGVGHPLEYEVQTGREAAELLNDLAEQDTEV